MKMPESSNFVILKGFMKLPSAFSKYPLTRNTFSASPGSDLAYLLNFVP
jgi:hypothetical protein